MDRETDERLRLLCTDRVLAYDALGRKAEADRILTRLEKDHASDHAYDIAGIYASRGELDQAFKWLDRAHRQQNFGTFWIMVDPLLKPLRSDPRFKTLVAKIWPGAAPTSPGR